MMTIDVPADMVAHFQLRVIQDAINEATADYWDRRASQLERGLPQPDDYPGTATPADEAQRVAALRLAAANCRNHAQLIRGLA